VFELSGHTQLDPCPTVGLIRRPVSLSQAPAADVDDDGDTPMNDASSKKQPGASSSKGKGGSQKASGKAVKGKKGGKACEVEDVDMADVTKLEQDDRATGAPGISKLNDLEDDTGCVQGASESLGCICPFSHVVICMSTTLRFIFS